MTSASRISSGNIEPASLKQWCDAVSQDLQQIAVLHDREVDEALLTALREVNFPYNLGMIITAEVGDEKTGLYKPQRFIETALQELPEGVDEGVLDRLAVDYADIYLNYSLHASPFESVWLDEDHLLQQEPMFEIREWYKRYGLETENWRIRSEDHLVLQLQFIAALLDSDVSMPEGVTLQKRLQDATTFMDEHLLLWLSDFTTLVSQRCSTDFYASIAVLTYAYMDQLRDALVEVTGIARPTKEEMKKRREFSMLV